MGGIIQSRKHHGGQRRFTTPDDYHCSRVLQENWNRFGCPSPAVVVYELPSGEKAGWCNAHRRTADEHARLREWKRVDLREVRV